MAAGKPNQLSRNTILCGDRGSLNAKDQCPSALISLLTALLLVLPDLLVASHYLLVVSRDLLVVLLGRNALSLSTKVVPKSLR